MFLSSIVTFLVPDLTCMLFMNLKYGSIILLGIPVCVANLPGAAHSTDRSTCGCPWILQQLRHQKAHGCRRKKQSGTRRPAHPSQHPPSLELHRPTSPPTRLWCGFCRRPTSCIWLRWPSVLNMLEGSWCPIDPCLGTQPQCQACFQAMVPLVQLHLSILKMSLIAQPGRSARSLLDHPSSPGAESPPFRHRILNW